MAKCCDRTPDQTQGPKADNRSSSTQHGTWFTSQPLSHISPAASAPTPIYSNIHIHTCTHPPTYTHSHTHTHTHTLAKTVASAAWSLMDSTWGPLSSPGHTQPTCTSQLQHKHTHAAHVHTVHARLPAAWSPVPRAWWWPTSPARCRLGRACAAVLSRDRRLYRLCRRSHARPSAPFVPHRGFGSARSAGGTRGHLLLAHAGSCR